MKKECCDNLSVVKSRFIIVRFTCFCLRGHVRPVFFQCHVVKSVLSTSTSILGMQQFYIYVYS